MGGHRAVVDGNRGTTIVLTADSFVLTPSDQAGFIDPLTSSASIIGDGELRLELIATDSGACSRTTSVSTPIHCHRAAGP